MFQTITALKLRNNLGELLNKTYYRGNEFIIERAGKPMAAIISIEDYQKLIELKKKCFKVFDRIQSKNLTISFKEVSDDVTKAIKKVRKK